MNIVLPPGSTSADLQAAIDSTAAGDVIILSGDMPFANTVTVAAGKEITMQSDEGDNWTMSQSIANVRHFDLRGSMILQNITLDGGDIAGGASVIGGNLTMNKGAVVQNCRSRFSGGGINLNGGGLTVEEGAVIQNCYSAGNGGGAYAYSNGTITIDGGIIRENSSAAAGGGIMCQDSTFIMTAGKFLGNIASASGGAIQMLANNTVTISGGIISGNTAGFQGGGIGIPINTSASISNVIISGNTARYNGGGAFIQGSATMLNVTISGNAANQRGGGIYSYTSGRTEITGESYIINNHAPNGGGIYTAAATYNNLVTGSETMFHCNWALTAYQPPADAGTIYPNIQFAGTSITDHPLNNFDINYNIGGSIDVYFNVIYDANGGAGNHTGPDIIPGGTDTVLLLTETGISRPGFDFTVWNTEPDGSGISYTPGNAVTLGCGMVLFAQWSAVYTITYRSNGGHGGYIDHCREFEVYYVVLSTTQTGISRSGFIFTGWSTEPDGSGMFYTQGEVIAVSGDVTLYARWRQIPEQKRLCRASVAKCRKAIEGQTIWVDNNNADNMRPPFAEILLLRDGEIYKRTNVDSSGDGYFGFCCLPVRRNSDHKYDYQIDETEIPGYVKTIEGYNVINMYEP